MGLNLTQVRNGLFLLMVALFVQKQPLVGAPVDYCSEACDAQESCNTACLDDLSNQITCLQYDGGPANGRCDGLVCSEVCSLNEDCDLPCYDGSPYFESDCSNYNGGECENTCESVCNPYSSSSGTVCTGSGGGSTTCGSFGVYLRCGDGICATGEECVGCSADCECPSTGMPPSMTTSIPQNPTFNATTTADLCQEATTHGFGDEWDCPSWAAISEWNPQHSSCDAKYAVLTDVWYGLNFYKYMVKALDAAGGCSGGSPDAEICTLKGKYEDVLEEGQNYYAQVLATPCYLFT